MPKKGEEYEAAHWRIDVDDETGRAFWRGAGADDKDESIFDPDEPLTMLAAHFPPGTRVVVIEPWDEEFYSRLFEERDRENSAGRPGAAKPDKPAD